MGLLNCSLLCLLTYKQLQQESVIVYNGEAACTYVANPEKISRGGGGGSRVNIL